MAVHPVECERARLWASLAVDAEISELELASLRAHVACCGACAGYAQRVEELAATLRAAPFVAPEQPAFAARPRRRLAVRRPQLALSAAAVAAALALGSLAGTLSSPGSPLQPHSDAAAHKLMIQQSLLALMAGSSEKSGHGGRIIPS